MGGRQYCMLIFILFILLAAFGLNIVGILTDNWYEVKTTDPSLNSTTKHAWNYHYGMWRRCFDTIPEGIPITERSGKCITTYRDLIKRNEDALTNDERIKLHVSRAHVAFAIVCGAAELSALIVLLCGMWPGNCRRVLKGGLFLTTSLILFFATICGITSGICFIALRDLDQSRYAIYPDGVTSNYTWSFMIHWIGTGLCLVDSFILLCLIRRTYDDVTELGAYSAYHTM
ncbi:uncharacterized protein LOC121378254 [Gigantopelta aegis]|uniref:uncharacterized protein LOC121378254 n=1 Tax=Gigantopelta aegis TaxID=1735272 RepID=UPI001B88B3EB|nr:uncharacterized protein LOC121378254 [Gigantopelta aegis]